MRFKTLLRRSLPLLLCTLTVSPGTATTVRFVGDLRRGGTDSLAAGVPSGFALLGKKVVFCNGRTLWTSEGTARSTQLLADFGGCAEGAPLLTVVQGRVLFWSDDELLSTDGTPAGIVRLRIKATRVAATIVSPVFGAVLLAEHDDDGLSLVRTDGTPGGTVVLLKDPALSRSSEWALRSSATKIFALSEEGGFLISDGTVAGTRSVEGFLSADPLSLVVVSGRALFSASRTESFPGLDTGLWVSDGTDDGTILVPNIASRPLEHSGRVYFVAYTPSLGAELWITDGTPQGTRRLTNFPQAAPFVENPQLFSLGRRLLFAVREQPRVTHWWVLEANSATPHPLNGCAPRCPEIDSPLFAAHGLKLGNRIVFLGTLTGGPREFFGTDGTGKGTEALGLTGFPSFQTFDDGVRAAGNVAFVQGESTLWITNGTRAGTHSLLQFPLADGPYYDWRFSAAPVGSEWWVGLRNQLWRTNGTVAATRAILNPFMPPPKASSGVRPVAATSAGIFVCATERLYFSSHGSRPRLLPESLGCAGISALDGFWFYSRLDGTIYRTNGTPDDTRVVMRLPSGFDPWDFNGFGRLGDSVIIVFADYDADNGFENQHSAIYAVSDNAIPLHESIGVIEIPIAHGKAFFYCLQEELWVLDRFDAPPRLVPTSSYCEPQTLVVQIGSRVVINNGIVPQETLAWLAEDNDLWLVDSEYETSFLRFRADGTNSTVMTFPRPWAVAALARLGDKIFIQNDRGAVWVVDSETGVPAQVHEEAASRAMPALLAADGRAFFVGWDPAHGFEYWQSDGTLAGTNRVRDVNPGPASSSPANMMANGTEVYFSADHRRYGRELWIAQP